MRKALILSTGQFFSAWLPQSSIKLLPFAQTASAQLPFETSNIAIFIICFS